MLGELPGIIGRTCHVTVQCIDGTQIFNCIVIEVTDRFLVGRDFYGELHWIAIDQILQIDEIRPPRRRTK
jgi:hypothetical protein